MSKPLTKGIYRERCDVVGPLGLARVERVAGSLGPQERYTVRFYAREAPMGTLVAVCWRYNGPPSDEYADTVPQVDGGWTRALAIAEDYTLGSAEDGYRV